MFANTTTRNQSLHAGARDPEGIVGSIGRDAGLVFRLKNLPRAKTYSKISHECWAFLHKIKGFSKNSPPKVHPNFARTGEDKFLEIPYRGGRALSAVRSTSMTILQLEEERTRSQGMSDQELEAALIGASEATCRSLWSLELKNVPTKLGGTVFIRRPGASRGGKGRHDQAFQTTCTGHAQTSSAAAQARDGGGGASASTSSTSRRPTSASKASQGGVLTQPPPRGLPLGNGPSASSHVEDDVRKVVLFVWMLVDLVHV